MATDVDGTILASTEDRRLADPNHTGDGTLVHAPMRNCHQLAPLGALVDGNFAIAASSGHTPKC